MKLKNKHEIVDKLSQLIDETNAVKKERDQYFRKIK